MHGTKHTPWHDVTYVGNGVCVTLGTWWCGEAKATRWRLESSCRLRLLRWRSLLRLLLLCQVEFLLLRRVDQRGFQQMRFFGLGCSLMPV